MDSGRPALREGEFAEILEAARTFSSFDAAALEVWAMKAEPMFGDIYLQFREEDFGRVKLPGFVVLSGMRRRRVFTDAKRALTYIRKLHDDNLKGTK